jgi:hypothetical protein
MPMPVRLPVCPQVNYKNVMKQYGLGPNGGILTASNLFATRFDQVRRGTCRLQGLCGLQQLHSSLWRVVAARWTCP